MSDKPKTVIDINRLAGQHRMMTDDHVLTAEEVRSRYKVSRSCIWKWTRSGAMPPPRKIGRTIRWLMTDILQWEAGGCQVWSETLSLTQAEVTFEEGGTVR